MIDFTHDDMEALVALLACSYLSEPDDRADYEDGTRGAWLEASDINTGACGSFADELCEILVNAGVLDSVPMDGECVAHVKGGIHCWVWWRGRHYDAEAPEGVEDWRALPFWRRYRSGRVRPRANTTGGDLGFMFETLAATWTRVRTAIRRERATA